MNLSQIPISVASRQGASNIYNLLMKPKHIISEVRKKSCFIVRMVCRKPPDCCCKLRHCWILLLHSNKRWKDKWLTWLFHIRFLRGAKSAGLHHSDLFLYWGVTHYVPQEDVFPRRRKVAELKHCHTPRAQTVSRWNFKQLFFFYCIFSWCWKKSWLEGALHLMNF